jgi:hypothetical protein
MAKAQPGASGFPDTGVRGHHSLDIRMTPGRFAHPGVTLQKIGAGQSAGDHICEGSSK